MLSFTWQFYTYSQPAWESMLLECKKSQKSIDIEHYIFAHDIIGKKFIDVLKEKCKQGVKIRLLLDMVGCSEFYSSPVPEELRKIGIQIKFFNVISLWRIHNFTSWFFRDHKKVLVVDNKVGFTGGLGIRDNMTKWRDTNVRLEGDVVSEMTDSFNDIWERVNDHGFLHKIRKLRTQTRKRYFITNDPYFRKRFLYHSFIDALRSARKTIFLTTPYFIPDRRLARVLRLAVQRGVDVKVLIPEKLDVPVIESAANSAFDKLLQNGIRIFKYQPEFIHAKTAVVDEDWVTFGSFNLDSLSFVYNHEANVVTSNLKCAQEVKNMFLKDLEKSVEITHREWQKRGLAKKIREFFVSPLRGFL